MSPLDRVGPVRFQPLEDELAPVVAYLYGHVLDAGCGSRDISAYLLGQDAHRITRYDLSSDDPAVVQGPLEAMSFPDASFDSALCNAVLEHVEDAQASMGELARVVRPGGHIVATVPFLQPHHADPADFRRYTAEGLARLGTDHGLECVVVNPVHSFAQTLGWLVWEYALEKGGRFRRLAARVFAYSISRVSHKTDWDLRHNANTFQAVFRKPLETGSGAIGDWTQHELPEEATRPPTMLIPDELRLLHHLAEECFAGEGAIVDAGAFLGGSTVALADGLRRNLARAGRPEEPLIHSFDRFRVEEYARAFFPAAPPVGASFREEFDRNIAPYAPLIEVHEGDIEGTSWTGGPIEILFVDIAKDWRVCDWITWEFFPHLIPGRSLVVQQDYLYAPGTGWLQVTMERYRDSFEYVCDTGINSVVFKYVRPIPPEELSRNTVEELGATDRAALMHAAARRFNPAQQAVLAAARDDLLARSVDA
jgi:SAM-dependent methyltransferase